MSRRGFRRHDLLASGKRPDVVSSLGRQHNNREFEMNDPRSSVTVVDIDIPFGRLVSILVKVAIAAVPAAIIVAVFWFIIAAVLAGVFGGIHPRI